jgi:hypothetical protein
VVIGGKKKTFLMLLLTYSNLLKKTFGNKLGYDSIGINGKLLIRPLERRHNTVFEIFKHEKTLWYCKCGLRVRVVGTCSHVASVVHA